MAGLRRFIRRLRNFVRPAAAETELAREVSSHLDLIEDDLRGRGLPAAAARLAARRSFGGVEQAKERQRDERSFLWLEDLRRDIRYGVRGLRNHPGFAAVAVLTLAFGIGINSALFTLVDAVLLRPLSVRAPERLALLAYGTSNEQSDYYFSYPLLRAFRSSSPAFAAIAAGGNFVSLQMRDGGGDDEPVVTERVSGNYFTMLGVDAVAGRVLTASDERSPVVVLSHGFWTRRFGGDPGVVGRSISLGGVPYTIVGVAPRRFSGFIVGQRPDLWSPVEMLEVINPTNMILQSDDAWWIRLIGRLNPDVGREQAQREVEAGFHRALLERGEKITGERGAQWNEVERTEFYGQRMFLEDGRTGSTPLRRQFGTQLTILVAIVGVVLLIACANVANLQLGRAVARHRELAVRVALGAARGRVVRQLLTESLVLAGAGGLLGIVVAGSGARLLLTYFPQSGVALDVAPNARVLAFTAAVTVATAIAFGLLPALRASRARIGPDLARGKAQWTPSRLGLNRLLVASQVALTLFLLMVAGLFVRTLVNLRGLDAGFDPGNVVMIAVNDSVDRKNEARAALFQRILADLKRLPDVHSVSISNFGLMRGNTWALPVSLPGREGPNSDIRALGQEAGPRFFETMKIPLLRGRDLTENDAAPDHAATPSVVVINQTLAVRLFKDEEPTGRPITFKEPGGAPPRVLTVIGVSKDSKYRSLREEPAPGFVVPMPSSRHVVTFAVRATQSISTLPAVARQVVRQADPGLQVTGVRTLEEIVDESLLQETFLARFAGFFAGLALLLAGIGVYGVLSYIVSGRMRELAVRVSLGARRERITALVVRDVVVLFAGAVVVALPAAYLAGRVVQHLLFGVDAIDVASGGVALTVLTATALLAAYLPARRASRVDPAVILRAD